MQTSSHFFNYTSMTTMLRSLAFALFVALVATLPSVLYSAEGDTTRIQLFGPERLNSQQRTNSPVMLPAGKTFNRIYLKLRQQCPCDRLMGEWDYTVHFYLRNKNGKRDSVGKPLYDDVQIAKYITPYGLGLGNNFSYDWTFDVTDYAFMLTRSDTTLFSIFYDGWSQSMVFTMWLECVEGTPPYQTFGLTNLWQGGLEYGNPDKPYTSMLENRKFATPSNAQYVNLRVISSGHGFGGTDNAAEFSDKTHAIWINGTKRFDQRLWRDDCGWSPFFPQGGTWSLQRGGWCPGDVVYPWNWNITSLINKTDSTVIDYKLQPYRNLVLDKPAYYGTAGHVLFSTAPKWSNDARIEAIVTPNNDPRFARYNPICGSPIINIQNTGSNDITTIEFEYQVGSSPAKRYTWNASSPVKFMEERQATLESLNLPDVLAATERKFSIKILSVNGKSDEYSLANSMSSTFTQVPVFPPNIEINFRTNGSATEQGYFVDVTKDDGSRVFLRERMESNTLYSDSLQLDPGCYQFRFINPSGYGFGSWFTGSLGTGTLSISTLGKTLRNFSGDCGNGYIVGFRVGEVPRISVPSDTIEFGTVKVGESATRTVTIRSKNSRPLVVKNIDFSLVGRNNGFSVVSKVPAYTDSLTLAPNDSLVLTLQFKPTKELSRVAVNTCGITSNDYYQPSVTVVCRALTPNVTSVSEISKEEEQWTLSVAPSPSTGKESFVTITIDNNSISEGTALRCSINNALGQEVSTIYTGTVTSTTMNVPINTSSLANGMYYVVADINGKKKTIALPVIR